MWTNLYVFIWIVYWQIILYSMGQVNAGSRDCGKGEMINMCSNINISLNERRFYIDTRYIDHLATDFECVCEFRLLENYNLNISIEYNSPKIDNCGNEFKIVEEDEASIFLCNDLNVIRYVEKRFVVTFRHTNEYVQTACLSFKWTSFNTGTMGVVCSKYTNTQTETSTPLLTTPVSTSTRATEVGIPSTHTPQQTTISITNQKSTSPTTTPFGSHNTNTKIDENQQKQMDNIQTNSGSLAVIIGALVGSIVVVIIGSAVFAFVVKAVMRRRQTQEKSIAKTEQSVKQNNDTNKDTAHEIHDYENTPDNNYTAIEHIRGTDQEHQYGVIDSSRTQDKNYSPKPQYESLHHYINDNDSTVAGYETKAVIDGTNVGSNLHSQFSVNDGDKKLKPVQDDDAYEIPDSGVTKEVNKANDVYVN